MRLLPAILLISAAAARAAEDDLESTVRRVTEIYALVEREGADPLPPDKGFYEGLIPGMLRQLDPHSVFFDPGQFEQLRQMQQSTQKGFGSVVSVLPGRVIILQTIAGAPSQKAGLAPGDEILAVNGYEIARLEVEQIVALLGQSRQQPARLDVRRPGNARMLQFVLTPVELQSPSVERAFLLKPGIGYLRVSSFDESTHKDIQAAIDKLGGRGLKGLVLDLRNNPGGALPAALGTASLFLKPGQKLLSVRGRSVPQQEQLTPKDAQPYEFALAVLVNGKSASASEIVAGAVQDHDRGAIIGEPTFGKGLVETVYPLSSGAGIALTTALYYTPSGRSIQKPLADAGFALAATASKPNKESEFKTDAGRIVRGGGGIQPDFVVYPEGATRLRAVLEASGSFTSYATEYVRKHKDISEKFEITPAVLDEFQLYCSQRNIRPGVGEWSREREFIQVRLKTEIFNQSLGVDKGDEVEAQRDPVIVKALETLSAP